MDKNKENETNNEGRGKLAAYRPGKPINPQTWGLFMESESWQNAPRVYSSAYYGHESAAVFAAEERTSPTDPGLVKTAQKQTKMGRRYFSVRLECCGKLFADEVDKNNLLRILSGEAVRWQVPIADFALLDDGLYLIICKEGEESVLSSIGHWYEYALAQFAESLRVRYIQYYREYKGMSCAFTDSGVLRRYEDVRQAMQECCRVHYLPLRQRYVDDIRMYWFSGFIMVRGRFAWNFMDPTGMLMDLAKTPGKAIRRYEALHRLYLRMHQM